MRSTGVFGVSGLILSLFGCAAAGVGETGEGDKLDGPTTLLTVTGTSLEELGEQTGDVKVILRERLTALGFEPTNVAAEAVRRGELLGIEYSFEQERATDLRHVHGFFSVGGTMAFETVGGRGVLSLDYGYAIHTADGAIAGPRIDRFSTHLDDPVLLSHVSTMNEQGQAITHHRGRPAWVTQYKSASQLYRSSRYVAVYRQGDTVREHRGGRATAPYYDAIAPSEALTGLSADEAIVNVEVERTRECDSCFVRVHVRAEAVADVGELPVSVLIGSWFGPGHPARTTHQGRA